METVDDGGTTTGAVAVGVAHEAPGVWHRAFSVVLVGPGGRTLLQRRARTKGRFGGVWANTCCGHVRPGAPVPDQARLRVRQELGLVVGELTEVGRYRYEARDPAGPTIADAAGPGSGVVERELDHVLLAVVGQLPELLRTAPDPAEVEELAWVPIDDERAWPRPLAPWAGAVLRLARDAVPT